MAGKKPSKTAKARKPAPSKTAKARRPAPSPDAQPVGGTAAQAQQHVGLGAKNAESSDGASANPKTSDAQGPQVLKALLERFIETVTTTAEAKGWSTELTSRDQRSHRYASVAVWRDDVSGTLELSIEQDGSVRYPIHPEDAFNTTGLDDLARSINSAVGAQPWIRKPAPRTVQQPSLDRLLEILKRFHGVARQLRKRHGDRPTLDISDEYDVQDLLHALLRSRFDDVRPEDAVPSPDLLTYPSAELSGSQAATA
jgi:hypothetical protein